MMLKKAKTLLLALAVLLLLLAVTERAAAEPMAADAAARENEFKVVGYYSGSLFDEPVEKLPTDKLTHVIYAFLIPNADGSLKPLDKPEQLAAVVKQAHRDGAKVYIALGGWSYDNQPLAPTFEKVAADDALRRALVQNVAAFVADNDLDGAELDWEHPNAQTIGDYEKLAVELAAALQAEGKALTGTVNGAWSATEGPEVSMVMTERCLNCFEFINVMGYDMNDADHSPLWFAATSIDYWLGRGVEPAKIVLGMPLYARPSWLQYRDLVALDPDYAYTDYAATQPLASHYNGLNTLREKTLLALDKAGGVMLFDINEDVDRQDETLGRYSAVDMIAATIEERRLAPTADPVGGSAGYQIDYWRHDIRTATLEGKKGTVDEEGQSVIPLKYDTITILSRSYLSATEHTNGVTTTVVLTPDNTLVAATDQYRVTYYDGEHSILGLYDRWAFALGDKDLKPTTAFDYNELRVDTDKAIPYIFAHKDGKYGLLDWSGREVSPFVWDKMDPVGMEYAETLCLIAQNGLDGLLDAATGQVVAPCIYGSSMRGLGFFNSGGIPMDLNGKWGVLDQSGHTVVDFKYENPLYFAEGYSVARRGELSGLIDQTGQEVIPCEYSYVYGMHNGVCGYERDGVFNEFVHPHKTSRDIQLYQRSLVHWDNGEYSEQELWLYSDQAPFIDNGRTMVPIRLMAQNCGLHVEWVPEQNTVILFDHERVIRLQIGSATATVNTLDDGIPAQTVALDAPAQIVGGRTFVPLRFVAENAGIQVIWDDASRSVTLSHQNY